METELFVDRSAQTVFKTKDPAILGETYLPCE